MLRRSELPSVVTTNYAGLALNLQLQLANSRATLLIDTFSDINLE